MVWVLFIAGLVTLLVGWLGDTRTTPEAIASVGAMVVGVAAMIAAMWIRSDRWF